VFLNEHCIRVLPLTNQAFVRISIALISYHHNQTKPNQTKPNQTNPEIALMQY